MSKSFQFGNTIKIHPGTRLKFQKPMFLICQKNEGGKIIDDYRDICTLEPNEIVKACWIPVDPKVGEAFLAESIQEKKTGIWNFSCLIMSQKPTLRKYSLAT